MMIIDENIELLLFQYKEGMLDADGVAEVEQALANHPEWQELADMYDPELRLPAGVAMEYGDWQSLRDGGAKPRGGGERKPIVLRGTPRRKVSMRPVWVGIAAAACLLFFVTTVLRVTDVADVTAGGPVVGELTVDGTELDGTTVIEADELEGFLIDAKAAAQTGAVVGERTGKATLNHEVVAEALPAGDVDAGDVDAGFAGVAGTGIVDAGVAGIASAAGAAGEAENVEGTSPVAVDTVRYPVDGSISRELNDPMEQEVYYANIIDYGGTDVSPKSPERGVILKELALKTTTVIATIAAEYEERSKELRQAIEDNIANNTLLNNIIASLE